MNPRHRCVQHAQPAQTIALCEPNTYLPLLQVKLRGQRIELGEIEHALRAQPGVVEAVVSMDATGSTLHAYVSPSSVVSAPAGEAVPFGRVPSLAGVRGALPAYMVPSLVVGVDEWPRTSSGKIARQRLPAVERPLGGAAEAVAPRTPAEAAVRAALASVLGLEAEAVSVEASFFELGGNSLRAVALARRLTEALGRPVGVADVLQTPTAAGLAAWGGGDAEAVVLPPLVRVVDASALLSSAHPVSWSQSQLLTVHVNGDGAAAAAYNIPMAQWLCGPLEAAALRRALGALVDRHAVLRTTYEERADGGGFAQRVLAGLEAARLPRELTASSDEAAEAAIAEDASSGFELIGDASGVLRCVLARVGPDRHLLLVNVHHVAFDGASTAILLAELGALYAALAAEGGGGGSAAGAGLAELAVQYVDYALWQRDDALRPLLEGSREYWRSQLLEGALPVLELPLDSPRPAVQTFRGATAAVALSAEVGARLTGVCRQHGCTLFQLVLGVWSLLLCRHAGQDEVVVGSPYEGRDVGGTEHLIGYFVNTLALRVEAARGGSVAALLRGAREAASAGMRHAAVPFQQIVHELLPRRAFDPSRNAVYQAMLAWEEGLAVGSASMRGAAVEVQPMVDEGESAVAKVELTLGAALTAEGGVGGGIEFNTDLLTRRSAGRLSTRLGVLAGSLACASADAPAWAVRMADDDEAASVLWRFNDTSAAFPSDACAHELVAAQAARQPSAIALEWRGATMAYASLHACAERVGAWLRSRGVAADGVVALQLDRSLEQVVGVCGVLRAGGAYLPLDPSWPLARRLFMAADARCEQLVAQGAHASELSSGGFGGAALALDDARRVPSVDGGAVLASSTPRNVAYVIYTSGSTGKPKGVVVPHGGVVNLLGGARLRYEPDASSSFGLSTSYTFDVFVSNLFSVLTVHCGVGRLLQDGLSLATLSAEGELTHVAAVPSVLVVARLPPSIRHAEVAGEALTQVAVDSIPSHAHALNYYGPTEGTVYATRRIVARGQLDDQGSRLASIGSPLPNMSCYVVDPDAPTPTLQPMGVWGELWLGGVQVARGYLDRPELTADRFVASSNAEADSSGRGVLYRTGDRVRWYPDGELEFGGRIDLQVREPS